MCGECVPPQSGGLVCVHAHRRMYMYSPLLFSLTLVCAGPAGCRLNKAMLVEVLQTDKIQTQSQTAVSSPYNNHKIRISLH